MERRCAMTSIFPTLPRGSTPGLRPRRFCTRNNSSSKPCILRREATNDCQLLIANFQLERFASSSRRTELAMNFHLRIWRQKNARVAGSFVDYDARGIPADASFLEMLDIV